LEINIQKNGKAWGKEKLKGHGYSFEAERVTQKKDCLLEDSWEELEQEKTLPRRKDTPRIKGKSSTKDKRENGDYSI